MKKDEVIELLKEQIKELRDDNNRLLDQIDDLIKEVSSLKEALLQQNTRPGKEQQGKRSPQGIPLGGCGHKHQDDIPAL